MSLRSFHIGFIAISSFLMIFIAIWSYRLWSYYADSSYISYLLLSIFGLIGLIVYGIKFFKKYINI